MLYFLPMTVNTFLFDLDGTLVDTALDLGWTLNQLLSENNLKNLPLATIRPAVSHGALAMIKLGFSSLSVEEQKIKQQRFLDIYKKNIAKKSQIFTGIAEIIKQVQWGIVTNKSTELTHQLLKQLDLNPAVVVCGDTLEKAKPHPEPLFYACAQLGVKVDDCIFIGDDENDILAAKNAKMKSIAVTYGYGKNPETWGADWVINNAKELEKWI